MLLCEICLVMYYSYSYSYSYYLFIYIKKKIASISLDVASLIQSFIMNN